MESEIVAPIPLLRLHRDAQEDSLVAAYTLIIVAPLSLLASRWLLRGGEKTTPTQVVLTSLAVPLAFIGLPAAYQWVYGPENVYQMLNLSRLNTPYAWARKYAYWREMFSQGQISQDVWMVIDAAYDTIYNEKARYLYDFWGPDKQNMPLLETQCNVGLFYLLWAIIIYALTCPKSTARASTWAYSGLLAIFGFDMAVRLMQYDPMRAKGVLPFVTPNEAVQWLHRVFPIFVITVVTIKRVFYVDLALHHQQVLQRMLAKNAATASTLQAIANELDEELLNETTD